MKIDLDYLKNILLRAQNSTKAIFTIWDLVEEKNDIYTETFVFHLQILADKSIIVNSNDNSSELGNSRLGNGQLNWRITNLRLTANGHDFIDALKNDTVWLKIKKEVKTSSLSIIISTAKFLLEETIKNSLK
jgi:hypothetical protein